MPAASTARVTASETSGTKSAKTAEPKVVRTPAVRLRSLIAVGTPHSGDRPRRLVAAAATGRRPVAGELRGARDERADVVERGVEVVLDQLERRHLATAYGVALLQRGQVVQLAHAAPLRRRARGRRAQGRWCCAARR